MSNVKIDINASKWQSREHADEQIATLRLCIVSFREAGLDMDFSAVEQAKRIRDELFPIEQGGVK